MCYHLKTVNHSNIIDSNLPLPQCSRFSRLTKFGHVRPRTSSNALIWVYVCMFLGITDEMTYTTLNSCNRSPKLGHKLPQIVLNWKQILKVCYHIKIGNHSNIMCNESCEITYNLCPNYNVGFAYLCIRGFWYDVDLCFIGLPGIFEIKTIYLTPSYNPCPWHWTGCQLRGQNSRRCAIYRSHPLYFSADFRLNE